MVPTVPPAAVPGNPAAPPPPPRPPIAPPPPTPPSVPPPGSKGTAAEDAGFSVPVAGGPGAANLLSNTPRMTTSPRSILKGSTAKKAAEEGGGGEGGVAAGSGEGDIKRRISFADQRGGELASVKVCADLHYSAGADHSEGDDGEGEEKQACTIM